MIEIKKKEEALQEALSMDPSNQLFDAAKRLNKSIEYWCKNGGELSFDITFLSLHEQEFLAKLCRDAGWTVTQKTVQLSWLQTNAFLVLS